MTMHKALTIAGSDSSGGAGIQADLKTFQERGVYGMTALTTVVAQDENWGHNVFPLPLEAVEAQLHTIVALIGVDALKTGMLGSADLIELVARTIERHQLKNVVVDPVMVCKGIDEVLLTTDTVDRLRNQLLPKATVVTPNLVEAAILSGLERITTLDEMKEAAARIHALGPSFVLVKGGGRMAHDQAVDVLYDGKTFDVLATEKYDTTYTHGAGCTYSAAITAELAKGKPVREAVQTAKAFITAAIRHGFPLNAHVGPTNHAAYRLYETETARR